MSSNAGWDTFFRALGLIPKTRQQSALLRAATSFSAKFAKWDKVVSTKLEEWDKGFSATAYRVVREGSDVLRVMDELVEYHGGEDQGAYLYVLALGYLEQIPDAELEEALRRTIRQYGDESKLGRLDKLVDRHRGRVSRTGPMERMERINKAFKRYASHNQALTTLSNYYCENTDTVLEDTIREKVCSEGAFLLLDKDIMREVGNHLRREGTDRRKKLEAEESLRLEVSKPVGSGKQGVRRPSDATNLEQDSFDAIDHLEHLAKKASKSRTTKLTAQELESLALFAYMSDREAQARVERPANQIKQERHRAVKKFRRAEKL